MWSYVWAEKQYRGGQKNDDLPRNDEPLSCGMAGSKHMVILVEVPSFQDLGIISLGLRVLNLLGTKTFFFCGICMGLVEKLRNYSHYSNVSSASMSKNGVSQVDAGAWLLVAARKHRHRRGVCLGASCCEYSQRRNG